MTLAVFPDNTVLCNFGSVHRLDLLEKFLDGRGRWTEAVAYEASRSAAYVTDLLELVADGWLDGPIEIDDRREIDEIDAIRRAVFGGTEAEPLKHLGEAQTLYVIRNRVEFSDAIWISDDQEAVAYARVNGIPVKETMHVVAEVVQYGWLSAADGHGMLVQMDPDGKAPRRAAKPSDLHHL